MQTKIKRLIKELNALKAITMINSIMLCALLIWAILKPVVASTSTATGGNVATNLSISGNESATNRPLSGNILDKAKRRGYFTASEYAKFDGCSLETVYRRANSGQIVGAKLVDGRWHIPLTN